MCWMAVVTSGSGVVFSIRADIFPPQARAWIGGQHYDGRRPRKVTPARCHAAPLHSPASPRRRGPRPGSEAAAAPERVMTGEEQLAAGFEPAPVPAHARVPRSRL